MTKLSSHTTYVHGFFITENRNTVALVHGANAQHFGSGVLRCGPTAGNAIAGVEAGYV
jgi:hypothetical protein